MIYAEDDADERAHGQSSANAIDQANHDDDGETPITTAAYAPEARRGNRHGLGQVHSRCTGHSNSCSAHIV